MPCPLLPSGMTPGRRGFMTVTQARILLQLRARLELECGDWAGQETLR